MAFPMQSKALIPTRPSRHIRLNYIALEIASKEMRIN